MKIKRVNPKCSHHKEKFFSFLSLYIYTFHQKHMYWESILPKGQKGDKIFAHEKARSEETIPVHLLCADPWAHHFDALFTLSAILPTTFWGRYVLVLY